MQSSKIIDSNTCCLTYSPKHEIKVNRSLDSRLEQCFAAKKSLYYVDLLLNVENEKNTIRTLYFGPNLLTHFNCFVSLLV